MKEEEKGNLLFSPRSEPRTTFRPTTTTAKLWCLQQSQRKLLLHLRILLLLSLPSVPRCFELFNRNDDLLEILP